MNRIAIALTLVSAIVIGGCGDAGQKAAPPKEFFQKSAAPPQWRGPGQPGGPSAGPVSGPPPGKMGGGAPAAGGTQ